MYCRSTAWKNILGNNTSMFSKPFASQKGLMEREFNISWLKFSRAKDIKHRLKTYFKFLVVRHPFDRLVSGYKDKLANSNIHYERSLGKKILKMIHPNLTKRVLRQGKGVTFPEFVKYIISNGNHIKDPHFRNMHELCYPCHIQYDYIAKLETHNIDAYNIITTRLSGKGVDSLTAVHSTTGGASMGKALPQYKDVSGEDMEALAHRFDADMHLFGYTLVQDKHGTVRAKCGEGNKTCC